MIAIFTKVGEMVQNSQRLLIRIQYCYYYYIMVECITKTWP